MYVNNSIINVTRPMNRKYAYILLTIEFFLKKTRSGNITYGKMINKNWYDDGYNLVEYTTKTPVT